MSNPFRSTLHFAALTGIALLALAASAEAQGIGWESMDNGILNVTVKGTGAAAGTWKAEFADNNQVWTPAEVGQAFAGRSGAGVTQTFNSEFALILDGTNRVFGNDPNGGTDLTGFGYNPTSTVGATANAEFVETRYDHSEVETGLDFTILQRITLHDRASGPEQFAATSIQLDWTVCNNADDPLIYGFQATVDSETYTNVNSFYNYLDAAIAPMGTLSDRSDQLWGPAGQGVQGIHLRDDGFAGELASSASDPKYDFWATIGNWKTPGLDEGDYPSLFLVDRLATLDIPFNWQPDDSGITNSAIAWIWGYDGDRATIFAYKGDCHEYRVHLAPDQNAILEPPEPEPQAGPVPTIEFGPSPQTCADSSFKFSAYNSRDQGTLPKDIERVRWTIMKGAQVIEVYPPAGSDDTWREPNYNITRTFEEAGTYTIKFRLWFDNGGADLESREAEITVTTIGDPNCTPVITKPQNLVLNVDDIVSFVLQVDDVENDRLIFEHAGLPASATLDRRMGAFYWQVRASQCGEHEITVTVGDGFSTAEVSWIMVVLCDGSSVSASDRDQDGVQDNVDNCYIVANRDQSDIDNDGIGDACDGRLDTQGGQEDEPFYGYHEAPSRAECDAARQGDLDGDGVADPCDSDMDGDGIVQSADDDRVILDNCPFVANREQLDADQDGVGDACDGTAGEGFETLVQEVQAKGCIDCLAMDSAPAAEATQSRVSSGDIWMAGLGMVLVIGSIAGALAIVSYRRR